MNEGTDAPAVDTSVRLPDGTELPGIAPVVIVGANGSGKTRRARDLQVSCPIQFINALRNTRIQASLPAMSYTDAENNFTSHRNQSRTNYWDWTNEFEFLLASLMAQHATNAIKFMDATLAGETALAPTDAFQKLRDLWREVFLGRELAIEEYRPVIRSTTTGEMIEYSAQTMSDGERTAIFLAGQVLRSQPGVLVVDEPEMHLHSLLAARFWDALESVRPDIRFVYITHDLTFARSRRGASYVLASPVDGLKAVDIADGLSDDVAELLLGTASLSFYARRIVLCEGEADDRDAGFYSSWFNDRDTVVRAVGGSDMVHRCMSALHGGWLIDNVHALGIIDRDFHSDEYLAALPPGLLPLAVHELESLYCLPGVVSAVAAHLKRPFDAVAYLERLKQSVSSTELQKVILERWKRRVEPRMIGVVAAVQSRTDSLDTIVASLPQTFASSSWGFSPTDLLEEEKRRVESAVTTGTVDDLLTLLPGKGRLAAAAQYVGQQPDHYINLVNESLSSADGRDGLGATVEAALINVLPARVVGTNHGI